MGKINNLGPALSAGLFLHSCTQIDYTVHVEGVRARGKQLDMWGL